MGLFSFIGDVVEGTVGVAAAAVGAAASTAGTVVTTPFNILDDIFSPTPSSETEAAIRNWARKLDMSYEDTLEALRIILK